MAAARHQHGSDDAAYDSPRRPAESGADQRTRASPNNRPGGWLPCRSHALDLVLGIPRDPQPTAALLDERPPYPPVGQPDSPRRTLRDQLPAGGFIERVK